MVSIQIILQKWSKVNLLPKMLKKEINLMSIMATICPLAILPYMLIYNHATSRLAKR